MIEVGPEPTTADGQETTQREQFFHLLDVSPFKNNGYGALLNGSQIPYRTIY
jgi:hypothetical protein